MAGAIAAYANQASLVDRIKEHIWRLQAHCTQHYPGSMNRPVNELQVQILQWIADDCPGDRIPTEGHLYKTSAAALKGRGLVSISRRGGQWSAEVTEAGRHYLEHGDYPPTAPVRKTAPGPRRQQTRRHPAPARDSAYDQPDASGLEGQQHRSAAEGFPGLPELPIATQIRNPHPAVKELLDHPKRLDMTPELRRRVHLMAHTLVQEALLRGWKVTAVSGPDHKRSLHGYQVAHWPRVDLFRIDAGDCPIGIQFRDKLKRVTHVDTPDEARRRAQGKWVYTPTYDFQPTGLLQLRLRSGTLEEGAWVHSDRTPLENRLPAVLKRIQKRSEERREARERWRRQEEEAQRRRERLEHQRERVAKYDVWVGALELMPHRVRAHAEQSQFVAALESRAEQETNEDKRRHLKAFIAWAQEHLEAVDPLRNPPIPVEEPPDMSYTEWTHWRERFEGRNGRGPRP